MLFCLREVSKQNSGAEASRFYKKDSIYFESSVVFFLSFLLDLPFHVSLWLQQWIEPTSIETGLQSYQSMFSGCIWCPSVRYLVTIVGTFSSKCFAVILLKIVFLSSYIALQNSFTLFFSLALLLNTKRALKPAKTLEVLLWDFTKKFC